MELVGQNRGNYFTSPLPPYKIPFKVTLHLFLRSWGFLTVCSSSLRSPAGEAIAKKAADSLDFSFSASWAFTWKKMVIKLCKIYYSHLGGNACKGFVRFDRRQLPTSHLLFFLTGLLLLFFLLLQLLLLLLLFLLPRLLGNFQCSLPHICKKLVANNFFSRVWIFSRSVITLKVDKITWSGISFLLLIGNIITITCSSIGFGLLIGKTPSSFLLLLPGLLCHSHPPSLQHVMQVLS